MRGVVLALSIAAVAGVSVWLLIRSGRSSDADRTRAEIAVDIERGAIGDLGRAQARGRRLIVANPNDGEAAALLAFADVMLAVDYGIDTAREAEAVLGAIRKREESPEAVSGIEGAARALLLLHRGQREAAARQATAATTAAPSSPHTLYALGRARAFGGDLRNAARALEAAIVRTPGFSAARVAWAEVRLDLGDAAGARAALDAVLARSPGDLRARLLLDEAEQALGVVGGGALSGACPAVQGNWPPVFVQASCALARAGRARRSGARAEALRDVKTAAALVPDQPRLLGRTAEMLAQIGAVDRAVALTERARRLAAPEMPALAWANAAIALGRGRAAVLPTGPRPADPEIRLLITRAALAAGGLGELRLALEAQGKLALADDTDLLLFARLHEAPPPSGAAPESDDPVRAYVDGLAAQFRGDLPEAAERFWHALSGHGDACRAAGEYVATLRTLKAPADPAAWRALRAENTGCVNLR